MTRTAVVTGASAGIGASTATLLAHEGFTVYLGARRMDRLTTLARELGGTALHLDVTDPNSVTAFCNQIPTCNVLVNNAGGALGLEPVAEANESNWETMYQTNVLGLMRVTRGLLPKLIESGAGHIVNIGSVAGREVYPGGGGYTAVKHAVVAVTKTLRLELLGKPVRVTEVAPGMAETEFSLVRFGGDAERAAAVYKGVQPLTGDDIADAILWAVTRKPHVNIDEIVIKPLAQANVANVHRTG